MKVSDVMSATVDSVDATATIMAVALRMADDDMGAMPIFSDGSLVGIVTDRDIAVRAVADGIPFYAPIRRIMTQEVETCGPDDDVATVLALMSRERVRRMPVCNVVNEIVGIVSLADAAKWATDKADVADTLVDICKPFGAHCQAALFDWAKR